MNLKKKDKKKVTEEIQQYPGDKQTKKVWKDHEKENDIQKRTCNNHTNYEININNIDNILSSCNIDPNSLEDRDKEIISILLAKKCLSTDILEFYINNLYREKGIHPGTFFKWMKQSEYNTPLAVQMLIGQLKNGQEEIDDFWDFFNTANKIGRKLKSGGDKNIKKRFGYEPKDWYRNKQK